MTTKERNAQVGMSNAYFESMKNTHPEVIKFYQNYGNGDLVKGFKQSFRDLEDLAYKVNTIWVYFVETKGIKLKELLECVQDDFNNLNSSKVNIYKWLGKSNRHKIEKKLRVLDKIYKTHKDIYDRVMKEYN